MYKRRTKRQVDPSGPIFTQLVLQTETGVRCVLSTTVFSHRIAAQVGRAPVVRARNGVSVAYGGVLVRVLLVREECLAALLFLALTAFTPDVFDVLDQKVTVRAFHGVAVQLVCFLASVISCAKRIQCWLKMMNSRSQPRRYNYLTPRLRCYSCDLLLYDYAIFRFSAVKCLKSKIVLN